MELHLSLRHGPGFKLRNDGATKRWGNHLSQGDCELPNIRGRAEARSRSFQTLGRGLSGVVGLATRQGGDGQGELCGPGVSGMALRLGGSSEPELYFFKI